MNPTYDDIAEQQADIVGLLLPYFRVPLPDGRFIRGVLPPPPPSEAVRVVVGPRRGGEPDETTIWEIPLRAADGAGDLVGADDLLGVVRALHTGTRIVSSSRTDTVMGMRLVRVDPAGVEPAGPDEDDDALVVLRTLVHPWTEERPVPRLRGFLLRGPDRLRLYCDSEEDTTVVAADVRLSGALTALLAALPSLIEEEGSAPGDADPHCSRLVDLTRW
ncbi:MULTISPECIES: hypothetical protein [Streptomyces]|uniref:hypothetical protein n=1 Tax=Streptomyces TaxID=1883 RepID=UPI000B290239|nr:MULTISPECIES: hypothetical protein [Streptomyces]MDH6229378.1 hypothetical protein [Streptomyces sp. MJP52]